MSARQSGRFLAAALAALVAVSSAGPAFGREPDLDTVKLAETQNGPCHVLVRRTEGVHVVEITGLDPDEEFDLHLTYEGRKLDIPIVVPYKGVVIVGLESQVRGESIGVGYVDFDTRRCRIRLSYPWRSKT